MNENIKNKKPKDIIIDENIIKLIDTYIPDLKKNFTDNYKIYNDIVENKYKIEYNVISFTKDNIVLKCRDSRCKIKGKINLIKNDLYGLPDPNGNIIEINSNENITLLEEHKIEINKHLSYIKDYISINFMNIKKKELFNINNDILLREYCKFYIMKNPDESPSTALGKLAKDLNVNYDEEISLLNKYIFLAKQYMYDNKNKLENYISKLEDIKDNNNNKICKPYPYKLKNGKSNILWIRNRTKSYK